MKNSKPDTVPHVFKKLAQLLGTKMKNHRLDIPAKHGRGYCTGFVFNEHIRMLILNYELKKNLVIDNPDTDASAKLLLFKFQNIFHDTERGQVIAPPSVLIATRRMDTDVVIPIHTSMATINIDVDAGYLHRLFQKPERSPVLQSLLENTQPLLFEQMIYPSLQKIVDEIVAEPVGEAFELFFRRVKAEELVCRLLMELEKRGEKRLYALNTQDIQTIYQVKEQVLRQLDTPPVINELAARAHMSPTKLKRLFKQVFGNSIFSYYQAARMKEAARLLKEENRSVSDVGYEMGFTNLSHFTRIFKEHIGMKPKQYSLLAAGGG